MIKLLDILNELEVNNPNCSFKNEKLKQTAFKLLSTTFNKDYEDAGGEWYGRGSFEPDDFDDRYDTITDNKIDISEYASCYIYPSLNDLLKNEDWYDNRSDGVYRDDDMFYKTYHINGVLYLCLT
jgi:hypothetical protein